ncbi:MAG: DUF364 domain-containing protein [Candidatus Adiutrix sp.]|jgi:uncharacterized protein (DUF4213/DUF364 family)|nr:DUF364 domain-containing protein [Candidatus Adiutrix sp.]
MTDNLKNVLLNETAGLVERKLGAQLDDLRVERAVFGLFFSGVKLSNGCGGLAFTPIKELPAAVCCPSSAQAMPLSGQLSARPVRQYLADLNSPAILKKTLALSVLNALSAACWQAEPEPGYEIVTGKDAFDEADIPEKGLTVVIGALVPMLRRLIRKGADFRVLEQDPSTLKPAEMPYFRPADQASEVLPQADLLVVTGVTILNDTLPEILKMARPGIEIIVTGPTASMLPDAFFKRGVTVLGGTLVTKPDELLDLLSEAGSGYHFFGRSAERIIIRNK